MANSKKRLGLIAAVVITGSLATVYTNHMITKNEQQMESALLEEEIAAEAAAPLEDGESAGPSVRSAMAGVSLSEAGGTPETAEAGQAEANSASMPEAADGPEPQAFLAEAADEAAGPGAAYGTTPENAGTQETSAAVAAAFRSVSPAAEEAGAVSPVEAEAETVQSSMEDPAAVSAGGGPGASAPSALGSAPVGNGAGNAVAEPEGAVAGPVLAGTGGKTDPALPEEETSSDLSANVYGKYEQRLKDLDAQIAASRSQQNSSAANTIRAMAETELNLWDKELNAIYGLIMDRLDREGQESLAQAERKWMKERDAAAEKAAPAGSSAIETAEYTASLAASTRARCYELLAQYEDCLKGEAS